MARQPTKKVTVETHYTPDMAVNTNQNYPMVQEDTMTKNPQVQPRAMVDDGSFTKDIRNSKWRLPTFVIGQQPYSQFKMEFDLSVDQSGFELPDTDIHVQAETKQANALKDLLYQCLSDKARALIGERFSPTSAECKDLDLSEYSMKLQAVFESVNESKTAFREFQARIQHQWENPLKYFADKIALFEQAYSVEKRDLQVLFDNMIDGLGDKSLRKDMRRTLVRTKEGYEDRLSFLSSVIEDIGITSNLYQADMVQPCSATLSQPDFVKSKSGINSSQKENAQDNLAVQCSHCKKLGHFARECSGKISINISDCGQWTVWNYAVSSDEESAPEEEMSANTAQTPPAAAVAVNTITASDAEEVNKLADAYFLEL